MARSADYERAKLSRGTLAEARRCHARVHRWTPEGEAYIRQCGNKAIPGGAVCRFHGGSVPKVKAKAQQRLQDLLDKDRILRETASIALSDVRQLFGRHGELLPIDEWPDEVAASIADVSITSYEEATGVGEDGKVVTKKTYTVRPTRRWDKLRALELLHKHLGLSVETIQHKGDIRFSWQADEPEEEG